MVERDRNRTSNASAAAASRITDAVESDLPRDDNGSEGDEGRDETTHAPGRSSKRRAPRVRSTAAPVPKRDPDVDVFDWLQRDDVKREIRQVKLRQVMPDGGKGSTITIPGTPTAAIVMQHASVLPGRYVVQAFRHDGSFAGGDSNYYVLEHHWQRARAELSGGSTPHDATAMQVLQEQLARAQRAADDERRQREADRAAHQAELTAMRDETRRQIEQVRAELQQRNGGDAMNATLEQLRTFRAIAGGSLDAEAASKRWQEGFDAGRRHGELEGKFAAQAAARETAQAELASERRRVDDERQRVHELAEKAASVAQINDEDRRELDRRERMLDQRERELDRRELFIANGQQPPQRTGPVVSPVSPLPPQQPQGTSGTGNPLADMFTGTKFASLFGGAVGGGNDDGDEGNTSKEAS